MSTDKRMTVDRVLKLRAIEILSTAEEEISQRDALLRAATERCGGDREAAILLCVDLAAGSVAALWAKHIDDPANWQGELPLGVSLPTQIPDDDQRYIPRSAASGSLVERFTGRTARRQRAKAFRADAIAETVVAVRKAAIAAGIDWETTPFVEAAEKVKDSVRSIIRSEREIGEIE